MSRILVRMVHNKCRGNKYPVGEVARAVFPDDLVPWSTPFPKYSPQEYNSPKLEGKPWADPPINQSNFHPKWNQIMGGVNRVSHTGMYRVRDGRPLNPEGRTGLMGRGILGRWGPNHAADPVVTRWKRDKHGKQIFDESSERPILQLIVIQRKDCGEWALPGGMIDFGELVSSTLRREFMEEAMNSLERDKEQVDADTHMVTEFFQEGRDIFKGYVDDPRNTDNAWMETVAVNFHDEVGKQVGKFKFESGDDASSVKWIDVNSKLLLYASHLELVQKTTTLHGAHWN